MTTKTSIPRHIWLSLHPMARLNLVLRGDVEMDADDLPIVKSETLAIVVQDINDALSACEAP